MYITQDDIEGVFGATNVAKWSNLDQTDDDVDTARVALAIAFAEEYVESKMRGGPYAVPFSGTSAMLKNWMAVHAGVWLYSSRGLSSNRNDGDADRFNGMAANADSEIRQAMVGLLKLPLAAANPTPTTPVVIT